MLSRKAVCLWLLAASLSIGLAVSAVVVAQQPSSGPPAPEASEEPVEATAGGGGFEGTGVAVGTVESGGASSRSRRPNAGGGGFADESVSQSGTDTAGPGRIPSSSNRSRSSAAGGYSRYYGGPANVSYGSVQDPTRYSGYYAYRRAKPLKPDPEMEALLKQDATMEAHARVLAKQCRDADNQAERAKVRAELEEHTRKHFGLRQERRELELSRLEEQLERVRASIKKRNEVKDLIIQRRIARLLGEEDDLAF